MALRKINPVTVHRGDGWYAQKLGRVVWLTLNQAETPVQLADEVRPAGIGRMVVVDSNGQSARAIVNSTTNTIYWDGLTGVYGTITYIT